MLKRNFLVRILLILCLFLCIILNNNIDSKTISTDKVNLNNKAPKELAIARIEIKDLGINNYIYKLSSKYNNVDQNVTLLEQSIFPDKENSIVFLAAHSGNSKVSFFNNLNKINKQNEIYFYYDGYKYIYKLINIYETEKDGDIEINKRPEKQLILTTCSTKNKDKQLIVESIYVTKEKISNL